MVKFLQYYFKIDNRCLVWKNLRRELKIELIIHEKINASLDTILAQEKLIGEELKELIQSFKEKKEAVGYSFGTLCVIHYEEYVDTFNEDIYKIGAAIELLILSFDIIDDLQDNDTDYIWTKTPKFSLNAVLAMRTIASKVMRQSSFEHRELTLQIIEQYTLLSINGQQLDLLNVCRDESSYLQMITQKSGSLTAMSCLVGFILAQGKKSEEVEAYATALGVIQQIRNDIQDLKEWNRKNDLLNKKYSLPIIYIFSLQNDLSKKLERYYNKDESLEILGDNLMEIIKNTGAISYALAIKNLYKYPALKLIRRGTLSIKRKNYLKKLME